MKTISRIIISLLVFLSCPLFSQDQTRYFDNITVQDGLPGAIINDILEDKYGFTWMATNHGLCRYDGENFRYFMADPFDNNGLSSNLINDLEHGGDSLIWIVTNNGICKYSFTDDRIRPAQFQSKLPPGLLHTGIMIDLQGWIWISLEKDGVLLYKTEKSSPLILNSSPGADYQIPGNDILFVHECHDGDIMISCHSNGLCFFNKPRNKIIPLDFDFDWDFSGTSDKLKFYNTWDMKHLGKNKYVMLGNKIFLFDKDSLLFSYTSMIAHYKRAVEIIVGKENDYWVCTEERGLFRFNKQTMELLENIRSNNQTNLIDDRVNGFFAPSNQEGLSWVYTKNGISIYSENGSKITRFISNDQYQSKIGNKLVFSIFEDTKGRIWFGHKDGDVSRYDPGKDKYQSFNVRIGVRRGTITSFSESPGGNIWFTTNNGYLAFFDQNDQVTKFGASRRSEIGLFGWDFSGGTFDKEGNYWITTIGDGIYRYNSEENHFYQYLKEDSSGIANNTSRAIFEDTLSGTIWFGTDDGISIFNKSSLEFTKLQLESPSPYPVKVSSICRLDKDYMTLGSLEQGLFLMDNDYQIKQLTFKDGIPSNQIMNVQSGQQHLWITTGNAVFSVQKEGLRSSFTGSTSHPLHDYIEKIPLSHEMTGGVILNNAVAYLTNGEIILGTTKGALRFNPDNFIPAETSCKSIISGLQLFNKPVKVGEEVNQQVVLTKSILELGSLKLSHENNDFTIEFTTFDYNNAIDKRVRYKLSGYDNQWNTTDRQSPRAKYTNLQKGNYELLVYNINKFNPEEAPDDSLLITIQPAWWDTTLFKFIAIALLMGLVLFAFRLRVQVIKKQKANLERKVKERTLEIEIQKEEILTQAEQLKNTNDRLQEINHAKDKLFGLVAHDIRNPFQNIVSLSEILVNTPEQQGQKEAGKLIFESSKNLATLLENILLWSKSQLSSIQPMPEQVKLKEAVNQAIKTLDYQAKKKTILFRNQVAGNLVAFVDKEMLQTILRNILGNAIKYSFEKGIIRINASENVDFIGIVIKDEGVGIPPDKLDTLLKLNQGISETGTTGEKGTGLGLIICKEFVEKNNGYISIESDKTNGTTVTISLPKDHTTTRGEQANQTTGKIPAQPVQGYDDVPEQLFTKHALSNKKLKLLVVDDNPGVVIGLVEFLSDYFQTTSAENGKQALELIAKEPPDLVICDWSMPVMNGLEVCRHLKEDPATSHIPFILLTGNKGEENMIKGLKTGADEYIEKPYNTNILKTRIANILENREKLKETFSKGQFTSMDEIAKTPADQVFLNKATEIVLKNLSNLDFTANDLVQDLEMSRTGVYHKLNTLVGMGITEFIQETRLNEAAKLLANVEMPITEVAYHVGFKTPQHFTRLFKQKHGVTPREFTRK